MPIEEYSATRPNPSLPVVSEEVINALDVSKGRIETLAWLNVEGERMVREQLLLPDYIDALEQELHGSGELSSDDLVEYVTVNVYALLAASAALPDATFTDTKLVIVSHEAIDAVDAAKRAVGPKTWLDMQGKMLVDEQPFLPGYLDMIEHIAIETSAVPPDHLAEYTALNTYALLERQTWANAMNRRHGFNNS